MVHGWPTASKTATARFRWPLKHSGTTHCRAALAAATPAPERVVEDSFVHAYIGGGLRRHPSHRTVFLRYGGADAWRFGGLRGQAEVNLAVSPVYKSTFVAPTPRSRPLSIGRWSLGLLASANKRTTAER